MLERLNYSRPTVEKTFGTSVAIDDDAEQAIARWYREYIGRPDWATADVRPIGLPRAICRELRNVSATELEINITGDGDRAEYVNDCVRRNLPAIFDGVQSGLAVGGLAIKPYVSGERGSEYVGLDIVSAVGFLPVAYDDAGVCVAGIFKTAAVIVDKKRYVKLEYHKFAGGGYAISNRAFEVGNDGSLVKLVPLETVPAWAGIEADTELEGVEQPLFAYMAVSETSSHVGKSVYSGETEDLIRQADEMWELFRYELSSGERKIIGTAEAILRDRPEYLGGGHNPLATDRLYVAMDYDSEEFFREFSPELRQAGYYDGLQAILRRIEFNVGLAYGDISDPNTVEKTASEIRASKQRKYATVSVLEEKLERCLRTAIYGINAYCDLYDIAPGGDYNVSIKWGDSVLTDSDTDRVRDMQEVQAGLMSKKEYRMKWYGEDEETATATLQEISTEASGSGSLELLFNS